MVQAPTALIARSREAAESLRKRDRVLVTGQVHTAACTLHETVALLVDHMPPALHLVVCARRVRAAAQQAARCGRAGRRACR
jgi:hypothetical protein